MAKTNQRSASTRTALLEATLHVAARDGIAGVTFRKVVAEAGLSLGTASYHFDDFDELVLEAFRHLVATLSSRYNEQLAAMTTREDLVGGVLAVIGAMTASREESVLVLTLYAEAARDPRFAELVKTWSHDTKASIAHLVDESTATLLELVWDGTFLQRATFERGFTDDEIRDLLLHSIGEERIARDADAASA